MVILVARIFFKKHFRSQISSRPQGGTQTYLTECILQLVLESQLPHKIVNLLFTITNLNSHNYQLIVYYH